MEKLIKKVRGMNWMARVSLVLIFTLVFSTFMHQGWYKPKKSYAVDTVVFLTSGASWTVPADWTSTNTIEVIGGGGAGVDAANNGGTGGGGGAYAKVTNVATMPAPGNNVTISIGAGGAASGVDGGNTWICNSTTGCTSYTDTAVVVSAKGGVGGTAGGAGGDISGVGTTEYAGGNGGTPNTTADSGGGGGGAAGPGGAGKIGGNGGTVDTTYGGGGGGGAGGGSSTAGVNGSTTGGNGGAGPTGTAGGAGGNGSAGVAGSNGSGGGGNDGGASGGAGGAGQQWDATHGAGGGGGGGSNGTANPGGNGGLYGGGGGGSEGGVGTGANGVIVITYTPAPPDTTAPTVGTVTPSNTSIGSYVDATFDLSATLTDNESNVTSCQYCASSDGTCDTEWAAGTLSGSSPTWTCTQTGITGFANGTNLTLNIRGTSTGGTGTGTAVTRTVDSVGPNSGATFTATPGNTTCTLNWASTTDAGVGMHSTEPYEVRWQLGSDPGSCSGGAQLYIGTALATPHNSLTNGSTYNYRLCYKDILLNQSGYSGNPITCVPVSGPPTLNPEAITANISWTNNTGTTPLEPARISDTLDTTYFMTVIDGASFNNTFTNDAAYSGKQIDNVRIYIRAYTATNEFIDWGPVISGTPYLSGTTITLTTTITDYYKDWATNPSSGVNWTPAEVDALEAQVKATKNGGGGMGQENVYKVWAVITYSEPVVSAINHNSTTTSSSKWQGNGGWGLTGTKYGEFVCATCHEPRATNIKSIKSTITAPSGTFPGSSVNFQSFTTSATDMGHDSGTTPRASSTRICEVCHTYDSSGGSGVAAHPYSTGATLGNHQSGDNTDCTSCHKHNKGFDAACDVCHGNPPGVLAFDPGPTGSATAGKHDTHVTTLSFVCENCHFGYSVTMPETPQIIDIGFSMWTKDGTNTSYNGQSVADGYRPRNNTTVTNTGSVAGGDLNCSNLYCHGAFSGGLTAAPTWTATSTAACGTCHANTAASATSLRASHPRHAGSAVGGLSVLCENCHNNGTAYTLKNGHVNGSVAWSLKTSDNRFGTNAKYNALTSGATGAVAPSGSYQTCTNLYCHSNVQSGTALAGPNSYGTPRWGDASVTCAEGATGCHNNPPATPTANSAHTAHSGGAEGYSFTCAACHNNGGYTTTANHANGTLNMTISATYGGTYIQGDHTPGAGGYDTCTNVYCHGAFSGGLTASPAWNGTVACGSCHANTAASATSLRASHPRHAGSAAGGLSVPCENCHNNGTAYALDDGHVNNSVKWSLKTSDSKFGASAKYNAAASGATGTKAPSASYQTCATLYCHSSVQANPGNVAPASYATPTWGAASVTCASCHGQGTASASGQPSTGSHERHVTGYSYACSVCHSGLGDEVATHANGTINLAFEAATAGGSAAYSRTTSITPQSGIYGNCTTTFCHGTITGTTLTPDVWGTDLSARDACTVCHGTKTTNADGASTAYLRAPGGNGTGVDTSGATGTFVRNVSDDTEVGAHDGHLRGVANISNAITCDTCHPVPTATVADIKGHFGDLPADMTFTGLAITGSAPAAFDSGTHTCSTVYCHNPEPYTGTAGHTNGGTGLSPVWNNQAYFGDNVPPLTSTECNRCHFYDGSNCSSCHYVSSAGDFVNAADNLSFAAANKGLHIDGAITVQASCSACHGTTVADVDNFAADGTKALINTTEWAALGHGRPTASGNYPGTNPNPPANFDGLAGSGQDGCLWCHDKSSADHGNYTTNPYRLIHMNEATLTNHPNDACLWCHDTNQTTAAYKAVATFTTGINLANVKKIDKWHYGTQHAASLAGGRFCWDCHDPHGDGATGPIKMIQKYPTKNNTGTTYGVPSGANDIDEAVPIVFTNNNLGTGANGFAMTAGTFRQGICNACHTYKAADPNKMDNYYSTGYDGAHSTSVCTTCHKHSKDSTNNGLAFEGDGTCTGCHVNTQGTRRAVVGEFGLTFGHHDATVTNADCVVCHMEGNSVADPTRSASHAGVPGGTVDLRDPDLGTAIASGASIFARNLSSNALETFALSIQNNHCLKCHDSNGANYLLGGQTGTDGSHTPSNPFVTGVAPANVDTHFATTNASFHPVKGVQNNAYCDVDTMVAPWDVPNGTHKPITCFDCHAASGATGNQTSTVVAHGNAVTLRKPYDAVAKTATQLCIVCHRVDVYWGTNPATGAGQAYTHYPNKNVSGLDRSTGEPEEWQSGGYHDVNLKSFPGCTPCHGTTTFAGVLPATQALRAENAHGFNTRSDGSATWTSGAKPWAFIRPTANFTNDWGPRTYPNATAGQCGTGMCGHGASSAYTPGGTF